MAYASLIEFASGEFAEYEFAREAGALLASTNLDAAGEAQAAFDAVSDANADLASAGSSAASFPSSAVANAAFQSTGSAAATLDTAFSLFADLSATGSAVALFISGYKIGVTMASEASSDAAFNVIDGNGFDIAAGATVTFLTGVTATAAVIANGVAGVGIDSATIAYAGINVAGSTVLSMLVDYPSDFTMSSTGSSLAMFSGNRQTATTLTAAASSGFQVMAHAIGMAALSSEGITTFTPVSASRAVSEFFSDGLGAVTLSSVGVNMSVMQAQGEAMLLLDPGSPVFTFLASAYDVVDRPEENRTVEWQ